MENMIKIVSWIVETISKFTIYLRYTGTDKVYAEHTI